MKNLIEIAQFVSKNRLKNLDFLHWNSHEKDRYVQFFEGLANGSIRNDEEAAQLLCNNNHHNLTYRLLKSRLKKKMLNTLFFLETHKYLDEEYYIAYYQCTREYEFLRILAKNGCREAALDLAHSMIKTAMKYKLTDMVLHTAVLLRNQYGFRGMKKKYEYYKLLVNHTLKVFEAELLAKQFYEDIMVAHARSGNPHHELIQNNKRYIRKLQKLSRKYDSYTLDTFLYRGWISHCEVTGDYEKALKLCDKAIRNIKERHSFCEDKIMAVFYLNKLELCLHLKNYEQGRVATAICKFLYPKGSSNQLIFYEYYFLLAMHMGCYAEAAEQLQEAKGHHRFEFLTEEHREKWKIFEAYLQFVYPAINSKFKIEKFLNEVPIFSKDKGGYNISILIAQILLLLAKENYMAIKEKENGLNIYCKRYVKKNSNYRSCYFTKLLLLMLRYDFDYRKIKQRANAYLDKLKGEKKKYGSGIETIEVIPYETLWEEIMKKLELVQKVSFSKIYSKEKELTMVE